MSSKKYYLIFKNTLQEFLTYRLSLFLWRVRSLISFLAILFFWLAVYKDKQFFLGYSKEKICSYLLGVALLKGLVLSTRTADLAGMIRDGELSRILLIPVSIFKVFLSRDFADKVVNFFLSIIEVTLVIKLFNLPVYLPQNLTSWLLVIPLVAVGFFIFFFISLILSMSAFWTDDIWAVRWLFGVIFLEFFSGAFFPIDVLPFWLQRIIYLTPFPYLVFFPIKIWLGQISAVSEIVKISLICLFWLVLFYFLAKLTWKRGFRKYGAYGG